MFVHVYLMVLIDISTLLQLFYNPIVYIIKNDSTMKHYYFFLLVLLCVSCNEQYNSEEQLAEYKDSCELAEAKLTSALHGRARPLVIPLHSSDPTLFLIPVSDNKDKLEVDRLYLLEYDNKREFERNIYEIKEIARVVDDEYIRNIAVVTSMEGRFHEYELDGFMMHEIWEINNDQWQYKSNIKIPIRNDYTKQK